MRTLDLATWPRRDHFHFFRAFDEPFFGITVRVDATAAHARCRREGHPFFLYYLHRCLLAINAVEPFRYRIRDGQVVVHEAIHASATIGRDDGSFDFSYLPFHADFTRFAQDARAEIERIRRSSGLNPGVAGDDVIHFSAVPWLDFTGLSHARHYGREDSCPKISVGKLTERDGRLGMPVSIHGHHALLDGRDVGAFVDAFQAGMDAAD
ncbi:chloramphenicol O-acetyltransferase type A [Lewinella marina]|uniref:Chloramphenicol acetyltransferase n=1 Tax=Neolewinella marina TaxID=438751 RepID=A0A2G0CJK8_9BACT|nr:chloramphenicol acetyltransferase [Neolewinella marina]NJB84706.1 chloramphenicol O-acetyltransferase type A [Neolewinella marina]PHL00128.1 chloramphenicol acetyltransferase [Neolewinella marina]